MKVVTWTDADGFLHRSLLRDDDPDQNAPAGIPDDPPDLSRLDWPGLVRELHNLLVTEEIIDFEDVIRHQNGVTSAILTVMRRPIVALYRQQREIGEP